MPLQPLTPSTSLLVLLCVNMITQAVPTTAEQVLLSFSRLDFRVKPSYLLLTCVTDSENVTFWRLAGGVPEPVTVTVTNETNPITVEVTPEREGEYYCTAGEEGSKSNSVEVVAYPIPNRAIKAIKTHTVPLHSDVTIPCVFTPGVLRERYSVKWFKGLTAVNTTDPRISILKDFSLVINDVIATDASSAYYCVVDVASKGDLVIQFHAIGPSMELVVTGSLSITQPPVDVVLDSPSPSPSSLSPSHAIFTCTAFGLPPPSIMWLYQGKNILKTTTDNQVYSPPSTTTEASTGTTVVSRLYITSPRESHSGMVQCLVQQYGREREMTVLSSDTRLIVLPSSFQPTLVPTSNGVELSLTLPTLLPSSFSLLIYYYDRDNKLVGKSELVDPSFSNTLDVFYVITGDSLPPSVKSFFAKFLSKLEIRREIYQNLQLQLPSRSTTQYRGQAPPPVVTAPTTSPVASVQ